MMLQRLQSKSSIWEVSKHGLLVWAVPATALFYKSLNMRNLASWQFSNIFQIPSYICPIPRVQLYNKLSLAAKPAWNIPFPMPIFPAPAFMFIQFLRGWATDQSTEITLLTNSIPRKKVKPEALATYTSIDLASDLKEMPIQTGSVWMKFLGLIFF